MKQPDGLVGRSDRKKAVASIYTSQELRRYRMEHTRAAPARRLLLGAGSGLLLTAALLVLYGEGLVSYRTIVLGGILLPVVTTLLAAYSPTGATRRRSSLSRSE